MKFFLIVQGNAGLIIRAIISAIFILSAFGKLTDYSASVLSFRQLFGLPPLIAGIFAVALSILEVALSLLIWLKQLSKIFFAVSMILFTIMIFSYWRNLDCGCFGSLPYLSQFSFGGHLLLLVGMFFGLYYLIASPKATKVTEDDQNSKILHWTGVAAIIMMFSAFLTLPFTAFDGQAQTSAQNETADRITVEAAIANHNAIIIDARPDFQYELDHIPTAINIPYDSDSLTVLIEKHSLTKQALIVYCSSVHCNAAELLAEKLRGLDCKKVIIYPGGWEEWEKGKLGEKKSG